MLYINMSNMRMVCGILCKCYALLIVSHNGYQFSCTYPTSLHPTLAIVSKRNHFLCALASVHVLCLCRRQCNGWLYLAFACNTFVVVDHQSFAYLVQFTLQNLLKAITLHPKHKLKSRVPVKYLIMCFMNWATILIANAISAFVATIAHMINPTETG